MARYTYTVHRYRHEFKPPEEITSTEFIYYKQLLASDPNTALNSGLKSTIYAQIGKVLLYILVIPIRIIGYVFAPAQLEADIETHFSRVEAKRKSEEFWSKIKRFVKESEDFEEFARKVKQEYPNYR